MSRLRCLGPSLTLSKHGYGLLVGTAWIILEYLHLYEYAFLYTGLSNDFNHYRMSTWFLVSIYICTVFVYCLPWSNPNKTILRSQTFWCICIMDSTLWVRCVESIKGARDFENPMLRLADELDYSSRVYIMQLTKSLKTSLKMLQACHVGRSSPTSTAKSPDPSHLEFVIEVVVLVRIFPLHSTTRSNTDNNSKDYFSYTTDHSQCTSTDYSRHSL